MKTLIISLYLMINAAYSSIDPVPALFNKNDKVVCMYEGVFSYITGEEFVQTIPLECTILNASDIIIEGGPFYQHLRVDCTKDLQTKWTDRKGLGLVKGHKLNYEIFWTNSTSCVRDRN